MNDALKALQEMQAKRRSCVTTGDYTDAVNRILDSYFEKNPGDRPKTPPASVLPR